MIALNISLEDSWCIFTCHFFKNTMNSHKAISLVINKIENFPHIFTYLQKKFKNIKSSTIFKTKISMSPRHFCGLKFSLGKLYIEIDLLILPVVSTMQFFLIFEYFLKIIIFCLRRKSISLSAEQIDRYINDFWTFSSIRLHMFNTSSSYWRTKCLPLKLTHSIIPITSLCY